ncbi:MAG: DUF177 domain-containing protein [Bacteroidales bacterium]|jgi:uncharacterized metal-binding protein YceD (DUF177 family)|nr:DUF177 domain-containing protein [Bacteroidales bacterium]
MFQIPFSGLSIGHHTFEFHVDDAFFKTFDYDEISDCDIKIETDLEKTERFIKLDFQFNGTYFVPCDRCLEPLQIPVNHDETLIVNFGNENDFESEVWTISSKEHELILDNFIHETLVLLRPFSVMHDIEDCNPNMLAKLQPPTQPSAEQDPRWDALKALKNK